MASFALNDYSQVILDGSFFINRFPEELIRDLDEEKLYLAPTFWAECAAYIPHMTAPQRAVFDDNVELLKPKLYKGQKVAAKRLQYAKDLWSNLCVISNSGRSRTLLISSNLLLIQKVVLRQLKVDVYNLHEMKFLSHGSYPTLKKDYQCKVDRELRKDEVDDSEERSWLRGPTLDVYDENRWMQTLYRSSDIQNGLEAVMFTDRDKPDEIVKVFNWSHRTEEKLENVDQLQRLNREMLQCEWAAFPLAKVFRDSLKDQPVGFYMKKYEGYRVLGNEVHQSKRESQTVSTILDWCRMLVSQIAYLGVFGIYITDYNEENFLVASADAEDQHIIMLDTDSFCMGEYYGGRCKTEWAGWKILDIAGRRGTYVSNKADTIDLGVKLLYAEIFSILTAGQMPVVEEHFVADHEAAKEMFGENGLLRYVFPAKLWTLMETMFGGKRSDNRAVSIPSVDALIGALADVKKQASEADMNLTYGDLVKLRERGDAWKPNGLEDRKPEPEAVEDLQTPGFDDDEDENEEEEAPAPTYEPPSPGGKRSREPRAPRRSLRKVDRKNSFTHPRLMGAVIESQFSEPAAWDGGELKQGYRAVEKAPDRRGMSRWKEEQEQDRQKAGVAGNWLTRLLLFALIACVVWLCFFAQIDMIYQIRQAAVDFLSGIGVWWQEIVLPTMQDLWTDIADRFAP